MRPMKKQPTKKDLLAEAEKLRFKKRKSSMLNDAISDYEAKQPALSQDDLRKEEEVWSVIANQVVGQETF